MGGTIKALRDYMVDIESPWLLAEMGQLELYETNNKIAAASGCHDDRFMAFGMVMTSLHVKDWGELVSPFGRSRVSELAGREDELVEHERMMEEIGGDEVREIGEAYVGQPEMKIEDLYAPFLREEFELMEAYGGIKREQGQGLV